ncbi:orf124 [Artaxa digramma nucleopolyhedrovirus]|uniref:Orf124 n=1 Tax=Artaxa digramma nucleopolyhedrovirus TaxID=3070910 RepID=A0AAE6R7M8_9ABAC|nr:orf124 [Euproctis digramma nucleopolyhedrovirus]QHB21783.1 orf124 [Artaxa digramma nucleopolyhedrovirus]
MLSTTYERDAYTRNARNYNVIAEDMHKLRSQLYDVCQQAVGTDHELCARIKNSMDDRRAYDSYYFYYTPQQQQRNLMTKVYKNLNDQTKAPVIPSSAAAALVIDGTSSKNNIY